MNSPSTSLHTANSRGQRRREALIEAARELFVERGYSRTSLADIVARAGGSLATLYNQFGSKEGLFRAMIQSATDEMFGELELPPLNQHNLEQGITDIIYQAALLIQEPSRVAMQRAIMSEAVQFPDLAEAFYTGGVEKGLTIFAQLLTQLQEDGVLKPMNPELAAICLLEPVLGHAHRRLLMGFPVAQGDALREHAALSVRLFLYGGAQQQGATRL